MSQALVRHTDKDESVMYERPIAFHVYLNYGKMNVSLHREVLATLKTGNFKPALSFVLREKITSQSRFPRLVLSEVM